MYRGPPSAEGAHLLDSELIRVGHNMTIYCRITIYDVQYAQPRIVDNTVWSFLILPIYKEDSYTVVYVIL